MTYHDRIYKISETIGPITKTLKQLLLDIQYGNIKDNYGFQYDIEL